MTALPEWDNILPMSYLVLARKYRPQGFDALVGQDHVTRTLTNALESKRVAHAYIFSGPRGCGKTTTARILAKALNCVKGPTPTPCHECPPCKEIAEGASADDVLEIDGASNRGIDQIRELRDTVKYAPARGRYRIIIIDEAHQITDAGFNALLKTLEEPPPHAVFMMATTESQKIPATILSRCQRFQLKTIAPADMLGQLKKILAAEKVSAGDDALLEVARAASGGLRDALSLLDQVISYGGGGVTAQAIRDLLGLLPRERVAAFAAVLRDGAPDKILHAVQKALDEGFEWGQLAQGLADHFHEMLLWKNGVKSIDTGDAAALDHETALYTQEDLERSLHILSQTTERLRRSESPRVTFELACLELGRKSLPLEDLLTRLEDLESRLSDGTVAPLKKKDDVTKVFPPETPPSPLPAKPLSIPPSAPLKETLPPEPTGSAHPSTPPTEETLRRAWPRLLDAVGAKKPSLEPLLRKARPVLADGALRILCTDDFQRGQIAAHLPFLTDAVLRELGPLPVSCAVTALPAAPSEPPQSDEGPEEIPAEEGSPPPEEAPAEDTPAPPQPEADIAGLDPGLKKIMARFPGKLKKIESLS